MRALTTEQKLQNCMLAVWLWRKVKPETVAGGLGTWHCGTQACFGGHLATWPEFAAMGVQPNLLGAPMMQMRNGHIRNSGDTAAYLFGDFTLFFRRHTGEYPLLSDHEVVLQRLEHQISELAQKVRAS